MAAAATVVMVIWADGATVMAASIATAVTWIILMKNTMMMILMRTTGKAVSKVGLRRVSRLGMDLT